MRKQNYKYYKNIRTVAENRAAQENKDLIRAKRRKLPNSWDAEKPMRNTKSWKDSRKKKYRVGGRGKEYSLTFAQNELYSYDRKGIDLWDLEEYFKAHKVPYRIEKLYVVALRHKTEYSKYVFTGKYKSKTIYNKDKRTGNMVPRVIQEPIYEYIKYKYDQPKVYKYRKSNGAKVTWWSHKDIGIQYFLKGKGYGNSVG